MSNVTKMVGRGRVCRSRVECAKAGVECTEAGVECAEKEAEVECAEAGSSKLWVLSTPHPLQYGNRRLNGEEQAVATTLPPCKNWL